MVINSSDKSPFEIRDSTGKEFKEIYDSQGRLLFKNWNEIQGSPPITFRGYGKNLTECQIYGNTVQNGTPTPDAPVDVVGCGVRTENLLGITDDMKNSTKWELSPILNEGRRYFEVYDITNAVPRGIISANIFENFESGYTPGLLVCAITPENTATVGTEYRIMNNNGVVTPKTFDTTSWDNVYLCIGYGNGFNNESTKQQKIDELFNNWRIMLNARSTALPYEPYGYKLPLTINGTEYPIYLGEVETTRRIKKFVLTGEENWAAGSANYYSVIPSKARPYSNALCTHAKNATTIDNSGNYLYLQKSTFVFDTLANLKSYLAAQYAAGTPVTVWYVLAEPETAVVNEPIQKIGDYSDELSIADIPTINGINTISADTTVQPSGMYLKGKIKPVT